MSEYQSLRDILDAFDNSTDPITEYSVSDKIREISKTGDKTPRSEEHVAEAMTFGFCENCQSQEDGWGTYFGPAAVYRNNDGTTTVVPNINQVTPAIIHYWSQRAEEAKNPILKARYADLVWDFSEKITKIRPKVEIAQIVIDSIIEICKNDQHMHEINIIVKLKRALTLAAQINSPQRITELKDIIISYEDKVAEDDKPGLWGFSYDLFWKNKRVSLTEEQKSKIINDLENRLNRLTEPQVGSMPNPWAAEKAATRLADHYRSLNQLSDVRRVILKLGEAFEVLSASSSAFQASGWLQHVHSVYLQYNLNAEAELITIKLRKIGTDNSLNMEQSKTSVEISISQEDINRCTEIILDGDLKSVLIRIAASFIPKKDDVENQLNQLFEEAPLHLISKMVILDYKGRSIATVGSLDDDLLGRIAHQMSQNMRFSSIFLREVMKSLISKFDLSWQQLIDYLYESPIFEIERKAIIETGLQSYLRGDSLVATHLLIPQVEDAVRNLLEKTGGSVLKQSRAGGFNLKTFDELLRDQKIADLFGEDIVLYLRVLFTDQRGWNLRNDVCHGMVPFNGFAINIADRIIHALLCLALVRSKE
jgi:Domain of unknown function (DUF4209)